MPLNRRYGETLAMDKCIRCKGIISPKRMKRHAIYCSPTCESATRRALRSKALEANDPGYAVPSSTVGAAFELVVAADLMMRGFAVFRAMSPACSCDLAVMLGDTMRRVEVKTGHVMPSGELTHGPLRKRIGEQFDILAIVVRASGKVHYFPPLEATGARQCQSDVKGEVQHG